MSAIFKKRKVPKHLIIRDEYEIRPRTRSTLFKKLLWLGVLALLIWIGWSIVHTVNMS
ncbi:MAG: hypothetical protein LBF16_09720 [Pseudomonadales bacterium]|jgi:hypothetical protein|nr:hypothetical protein [Pseudomonadales bacterium]